MISSQTSFINSNEFRSIFQYSSLPTDDLDSPSFNEKRETINQIVLRRFLLTVAFIVLIVTFPISIWFSVKRIKPLQRCIVYRLGRRLPIKGPGLILVIPFIDVLDYIDLNAHPICVASREQMLTTDGSLIEIIDFTVEISISNAVRSSTQLKDSRQNVEQFIKLSFVNTVGGTHVEDLERKMEFIIKQYAENCNKHTNKWGWSMTISTIPKMAVISRSEPVNGVVKALKGYFGGSGSSQSNGAANIVNAMSYVPNIVNNLASTSASVNNAPTQPATSIDDEIVIKLSKLAQDYRYLSMLGIPKVIISLEVGENPGQNYFEFDPKTGNVERIRQPLDANAQVTVKATSWKDFHEAIDQKNLSKVQITSNLK